MVKRFKRPMRPSFVGLPCQYRKAAITLKKLMKRKPLPIQIAARNAAVSPKSVREELELIELAALDAITRGHDTWRDAQKLAVLEAESKGLREQEARNKASMQEMASANPIHAPLGAGCGLVGVMIGCACTGRCASSMRL